jgi:hypothetical protein
MVSTVNTTCVTMLVISDFGDLMCKHLSLTRSFHYFAIVKIAGCAYLLIWAISIVMFIKSYTYFHHYNLICILYLIRIDISIKQTNTVSVKHTSQMLNNVSIIYTIHCYERVLSFFPDQITDCC